MPGEEAPLALVLELVEGTDLEDWVAREGPLELFQATGLALQIVAALAHAHAHGRLNRLARHGRRHY